MDDIMTVGQLRQELMKFDDDTLVMVPVIKYPAEFDLNWDDVAEDWRWDLGSDVEVVPLIQGDVHKKDKQCWITVELSEFSEDRATLSGNQAGPNG